MSKPFDPSAADPMLLDLFRQEMERHVVVLNEGFLRLERNAGDKAVRAELMRAAHSIKGAARILDFTFCASLAHGLEEALQKSGEPGRSFAAETMDVLFGVADLFEELGRTVVPERWASMESLAERFRKHEVLLQHILEHADASTQPVAERSPLGAAIAKRHEDAETSVTEQNAENTKTPSPDTLPERRTLIGNEAETSGRDDFVRVNAESLDRLVALSGENLIRNRWLVTFVDRLTLARQEQSRVKSLLQEMELHLRPYFADIKLRSAFAQYQFMVEEACRKQHEMWDTLDDFTRDGSFYAESLHGEAVRARLRPFGDGTRGLTRMVRDLSKQLNKAVELEIVGADTLIDRDILDKLEAPMTHLLRNALDHGLESASERQTAGKSETGFLRVEAAHVGGMFQLSVDDDGRGIDVERIRKKVLERRMAPPEVAQALSREELLEFLFLPGFTTKADVTEISGRGVGLDIVHHLVGATNGSVQVFTELGLGTKVVVRLPISLSVVRTLIASVDGEPYALRLNGVDRCLKVRAEDVLTVENRQFIRVEERNVSLLSARELLGLPSVTVERNPICAVLLSDRFSEFALAVDDFLDEQDLVVHALDPRLGHLPGVLAASVLSDGKPVLILDTEDLVKTISARLGEGRLGMAPRTNRRERAIRKRVLVVDDSITVRELERQLLEKRQYHVDVAVDGQDGWNALLQRDYDLVVTDVDMPRMDGVTLTRKLRQDPRFHRLPVIIVSYKDREEDRRAGLEAGASHYLTKGSFSDNTFIQAVSDLIGEATS